jgi:hypothetical protein
VTRELHLAFGIGKPLVRAFTRFQLAPAQLIEALFELTASSYRWVVFLAGVYFVWHFLSRLTKIKLPKLLCSNFGNFLFKI